ncbi:RNA polymerase I-specific transcription initiation factor RRN3 [Trametes versicolor FP-101664 SS1]|uniref:RNA polymerase I-specific transcription initiation factor RRN3 n=1 Tax=Trametes versicolor (strain FP-101664) TaxID=717944 RepID=UPI000462140C|nr:RNA polymerase I-specific transcription initiation factor RRN3 [Trametes versicolor FP-101664 SS1]EIW61642.1 RNA polymerase I-specific transcription initiation factor RRN3 [Trametes versicolor FP-101664 SS1]
MDPHSRFSHFNSRQTKAGPLASSSRFMDPAKLPISLDGFTSKKGSRTQSTSKKPSSAAQATLYVERPIVTNSRIKQDEQYRKDMHLAFVNNALQQKSMGISDAFDELVDQFNPRKITPDAPSPAPQLRLWLLALSHVVSRLERVHSSLVEAIVTLPWTTMDTGFARTYTNFIGMLVSARPEYLSLVLGKIAQGLTYQSGLQALNAGMPESSSKPLTRRIVYDRIHFLLRHLLSLVPTLPSTLQPLLARNFPHKRQDQTAQVTYIRNLLRVTDYCPEIADRILATVIDRAIQIDVEIQVELEELEEQLESQEQNEMFELDPFDTVLGQEGDESDSDEEDGEDDNLSDLSSDAGGDPDDETDWQVDETTNFQHIQGMVNKLDSILKIIFDHFNQTHAINDPVLKLLPSTPSSRSDSSYFPNEPPRAISPATLEEGKALRRAQFNTLLSIFDRTILRTFKSRYTQFIVFWYSSLDPEFADLFQGMLVSKSLLEEDQPAVTRAAAASYIASFVSRAQFVDRDGARRVVAVLCDFLRARLDMFMAAAKAGVQGMHMHVAQHSVFYAVAQAVFLIFCFRWRDLLEDVDEVDEFAPAQGPPKKWMPGLDVVERVVASELNPLKVCSTNVVMQFARVAHATGFIYCYSIMEANRRSEYAPSTPGAANGAASGRLPKGLRFEHSMTAELNTFFPFDPYKLPRSGSYIQGVYREWSSVAIDDDEDEDDDDDEDEEEDEGADNAEHEDMASSQPVGILVNGVRAPSETSDDGLGQSFGGMSISPARAAHLQQVIVA